MKCLGLGFTIQAQFAAGKEEHCKLVDLGSVGVCEPLGTLLESSCSLLV